MDIVFDIDGTIADASHRLPYITNPEEAKNWDAFFDAMHEDTQIEPMVQLLNDMIFRGYRIIFSTGRPESSREKTCNWIMKQSYWAKQKMLENSGEVFVMMRAEDDRRPSAEIKRDHLKEMRLHGYSPVIAFEDRSEDVKMWREEGLICCQVAEGNF